MLVVAFEFTGTAFDFNSNLIKVKVKIWVKGKVWVKFKI